MADDEIFHLLAPGKAPFEGLGFSAALHAVAITGLALIPSTRAEVPEPKLQAKATEIIIGKRLYYVHDLPGVPTPSTRQPLAAPAPAPSPAARPAPPRPPAAEAAPSAAPNPVPNPAPAPAAPEPAAPEPVRPEARRIPRVFVPPEVRRDPTTVQTLVQPNSPPDVVPETAQLPSFQVWTSRLPSFKRNFVAPGQPTPKPAVAAPEVLTPPSELNTVSAVPKLQANNPKLALPPAPTPLVVEQAKSETPAPLRGDAVNVISATLRTLPLADRVVVPPGNIVGREGADSIRTSSTTTSASTGTGAAPAAAKPAVATASVNPTSNPTGNSAGSSTGANPAAAPKPAAPSGNGSPAANGQAANGQNAASSTAPVGGAAATASGPVSTSAASSGNGTTGNPSPAKPMPGAVVINRPPGGRFDSVVVQSSPLDQFPESRNLLSGRPIYTVYIPMGTAKDWAMYVCLPAAKADASTETRVVSLDPVKPLDPPYPFKMIRPSVTIPSYQKYVLAHGWITEEGAVKDLRVVTAIKADVSATLAEALRQWTFRAAKREGQAVAVEFVLAMPREGM